MSTTQTLETKTLIEAMESRAKEYRLLREQFQELKTSFKDIVDLDDFKGKTADSVKGFYRAQIDVVNSWIDFIDLQEAFFKGIKGMADDEDLGGKTLVHLPFLDSDLKNSESRARQMVDSQEQALEDIFSGISDIVSMEPNSTKQFDKHIDEATKKRKETKEKVENFDQTLLEFYEQSKYHENVIAGLISELYKASSQGGEVNPLYFNEDAYKKSDVHTAKEEAKEITANYISWQDELERARELENRSFGEKTWDTICTFTGEVTGYYDMKRASTGVDPVTGQELTDGQRATAAALAAAGFIPFVGWAGRAAKGGHAIYKTSKTFSAADNVLNAYKTTEAFDILKTSERGLYGLASANGFSEFITGRDIFGNPISEEEQQAGFERALLLLPFKGKTANPVLGVRNDARVVSKGAEEVNPNMIRKVEKDILDQMESVGGHTLERHVGKTNEDLIKRAIQENVEAATSFTDKSTATKAIQENLRKNADDIAKWLNESDTRRKIFDVSHKSPIGKGALEDKKQVIYDLSNSRVVLVRDETNELGFRILTGFPVVK